MITHVVLLQPKPDSTEDQIKVALHHVMQLQEAIPGIVEVRVGKNVSAANQGYTYGFIMQFSDLDKLKAYAPHPAHRVVSEELLSISQSFIDFDLG